MTKPHLSIKERFLLHVNIPDDPNGCWEWTGSKNSSGYGQLGIDGKLYLVHRISYALFVGMIPDDMLVCHVCDDPKCVNPDHLFLGTYKDNMHDMISKHREDHSKSAKGERNGRTQRKLTNEIVYQIREMIEQGHTNTEIARNFGVKQNTISQIKTKRNWKWLA